MSSGLATFFRPDGTVVGYGIYYGTADVLLRFVADTPEAAWEAKGGSHPDCACGQPAEPVVILSEYGTEWWWLGEGCPRCRCITGPCAPYDCQVLPRQPVLQRAPRVRQGRDSRGASRVPPRRR
jgi:hypothetical protein